MKMRYLGLFALAPLAAQCQPACTPPPPVPVETTTTVAETTTTEAATTTTTTIAATTTTTVLVPIWHMDIQPIGGSDVCTGEVFYNDGTGTLDLSIIDGNNVTTTRLEPGQQVDVAWNTLPPVSGGGQAIIFTAEPVTPGGVFPPEYVRGTLFKSAECSVP